MKNILLAALAVMFVASTVVLTKADHKNDANLKCDDIDFNREVTPVHN